MSLQSLVVTWILIEYLNESAAVYGDSRALMAIPPLVIILLGGVFADRMRPRLLLFVLTLLTAVVPLVLIPLLQNIHVYMVVAFGTAIALLGALGDPAKQAIINRVTRIDIQRSIVIVTVIPSIVGIAAIQFGSQLETLGIAPVLCVLAGLFLLSALAVLGLPNLDPISTEKAGLMDGLKVFWQTKIVRQVIGMNFVSMIFNAGGYMVVMPLSAMRVYDGDAVLLANMLIAFTIGSTGSNVFLFFVMPLRHPGRIYLLLQLTRAIIIGLIILQPSTWIFLLLVSLWGVNMGVTSTLVRTTVQEQAPAAHRAKILAFFLFSFMLSTPISAFLLGRLVDLTSPMWGLIPGIPVSLGLFVYGLLFSGLWHYTSVDKPNVA